MLATTAEAASHLFQKGTDSLKGYRPLNQNQKSGRSAIELVQLIKEKISFLGVKRFSGVAIYLEAVGMTPTMPGNDQQTSTEKSTLQSESQAMLGIKEQNMFLSVWPFAHIEIKESWAVWRLEVLSSCAKPKCCEDDTREEIWRAFQSQLRTQNQPLWLNVAIKLLINIVTF
jgi:hypothetical protein